jgi:hypothetical protein
VSYDLLTGVATLRLEIDFFALDVVFVAVGCLLDIGDCRHVKCSSDRVRDRVNRIDDGANMR